MTCVGKPEAPWLCITIDDVGVATSATVVIAVLTASLFILQYRQHRHAKRVSNANYQLALFDKRIETFYMVRKIMTNYFRDGQPSFEDAMKLRSHSQTAVFLFPDDVVELLNEMADKAVRHHTLSKKWEPLRARAFSGQLLSNEEEKAKDEALDSMHEIEDWFLELTRSSRLSDTVNKHLKLPEKL